MHDRNVHHTTQRTRHAICYIRLSQINGKTRYQSINQSTSFQTTIKVHTTVIKEMIKKTIVLK